MSRLLFLTHKKCPYCKKRITIKVVREAEDGYEVDGLNSDVKDEKEVDS